MERIAPFDTISKEFDTVAKFMSVMGKAGATLSQLQVPIDNIARRRNLVAFLAAGCPKIEVPKLNIAPPLIAVNEHGHTTLTFVGLDLSGAEEIERAREQGNRVGDYAASCLTSTKPDGYDAVHRLVAGQIYTAVLMPNSVIRKDRDRTTENLRKAGSEQFGYAKPLAGFAPRVREHVSDDKLKELDFWYAAVLHDPISDRVGDPLVLDADRGGDGRWLRASWDSPRGKWSTDGASVLSVPAS